MVSGGHARNRAVVTPPAPSQPPDEPATPVNADAGPPTSGSASTHRVMRGALALFTIQPLTWASSFLIIIYAPQYLGSVALGQWAMLTALGGIATTILGLGVPTVLVRRVAANTADAGRLAVTSIVLISACSLAGGLALSLGVRSIAAFDLPPLTLELVLGTTAVSLIQTLFLSILNGQHRLGQFAWLSAATTVTASLATVVILIAGGGLVGILLMTLLVNIGVTVMAWRSSNLALDQSGVNARALRALAIAGLPFAGMSLVLRLRGDAEVMFLGLGLSVEALGWWAAAERISFIALFVPTLLITPLMPALSGVAEDAAAFRATLRRSLDLTLVLTIGASCGIVAIAPAVPAAFRWGADFEPAIPLIELLSFVTPIASMGMILGTALIALGDERRWFVVSVVASSLHLIVTPAAIYAFNLMNGNGSIGAAAAKILIEMAMIAGALYLLPRGSMSRSSWVVLAKSVIASTVMIVAVRMVLGWNSWLALPASIVSGGLVYLAVLAALRILPPTELAEVSDFVKGILRKRAAL